MNLVHAQEKSCCLQVFFGEQFWKILILTFAIMDLSYHSFLLEYKHPFGVSGNTRTHTQSIFVRIDWDGFFGYGEACLPPYLGETAENTLAFFEKAKPFLKKQSYPCSIAEIIVELNDLDKNCNAAKAAIDIALHDLKGKIENKSVRDLYKLNPAENCLTACTIGIASEAETKKKIEEAKDFTILKIKAGTEDDKKLVHTIRKFTDKPLYIDVNRGWKDKHFAVDMIAWLKEQNVLLVEQPLPVEMIDDMAWITERSVLPTIGDESVKRLSDLKNLKGIFSGINIKLMKCTGLREAFEMIEYCKQNDLKIFLGCMAESSCGTSAMAQFMSCADYLDLDAPNLLKNDPFSGISYSQGKIVLNDQAGIGVTTSLF
jgi:L-alanine-DL-glutamate epimerase-like enolase superfamily enzyme